VGVELAMGRQHVALLQRELREVVLEADAVSR
jgi:hypothetical protein